MAAPNLADIFGANSTVLTSNVSVSATAADPVLVIRYSDFVSQNWDNLQAGDELKPVKWLTAIIRLSNAFSNNQTDDLSNVAVTDPIVGLETRDNQLKRRYSYSVDIYQNDSGASVPDPDLV